MSDVEVSTRRVKAGMATLCQGMTLVVPQAATNLDGFSR